MTIGAWVLVVILGIIGIGIAIFYFLADSKTGGLIAILITIIVVGGLIIGLSWFYNNTGSGLRAMKDQQSNLNNGINRDIKVIESDKGLFIAMPSRKTPNGEFKDIAHPINTETREMLQKLIIEKYNEAE